MSTGVFVVISILYFCFCIFCLTKIFKCNATRKEGGNWKVSKGGLQFEPDHPTGSG
ncbi:hypothetical protein NQ315_006822 [Exocentrus adspersus]|uniref:Uncharacterized protein n=1 Tax=Exocentrus adspersus TaxID=1586481 RepID=A0AAV8WCV7_9CUCU|nr:hypothetical protein NQ315_006822 [Exocentrus adspersus]